MKKISSLIVLLLFPIILYSAIPLFAINIGKFLSNLLAGEAIMSVWDKVTGKPDISKLNKQLLLLGDNVHEFSTEIDIIRKYVHKDITRSEYKEMVGSVVKNIQEKVDENSIDIKSLDARFTILENQLYKIDQNSVKISAIQKRIDKLDKKINSISKLNPHNSKYNCSQINSGTQIKENLFLAIKYHETKSIVGCLSKISNINFHNRYGHTPLASASSHGHLDIVRLLVKWGANVNIASKDKMNRTPLHYALDKNNKYGNIYVAKYLLCNGANPNSEDTKGLRPMYGSSLQFNKSTDCY